MHDSPATQLSVIERIIGEEIWARGLPIEQRRLWQAGEVEQCLEQVIAKTRRRLSWFFWGMAGLWLIPGVLSGVLAAFSGTTMHLNSGDMFGILGFMTIANSGVMVTFPLRQLWRLEQLQVQYRIAKEVSAERAKDQSHAKVANRRGVSL